MQKVSSIKRKEILQTIKDKLISRGFKPSIIDRYMITRSSHPQYYLRKETYNTREINHRLIYSKPELEERYKEVQEFAENSPRAEKRSKSRHYQDFFDEMLDTLFHDSDYILFPLDRYYTGKDVNELDIYAKISKGFYKSLCREAEDGRTVAAQAYYYLCGVFDDDQKNQWALTFDELYSRKHITEYFEGIHVINNRVKHSNNDDVPRQQHSSPKNNPPINRTTNPSSSSNSQQYPKSNQGGCLNSILVFIVSVSVLFSLLIHLI